MRRVWSFGVAIVLLLVGVSARTVYSADYYTWGFAKTWQDSSGLTVGYAYQPCPEDPGEASADGTRVGRPTTVERWMCDPQTMKTPEEACERVVYWGHYADNGAVVIDELVVTMPCSTP